MKNRRKSPLSAAFWICVAGLAVLFLLFLPTPERRTKLYFYRHWPELETGIISWQAGETLSFDPTLTVNIWGEEEEIVEYIVTGWGLAPASDYYGFFYSRNDVPVSFQNGGEVLTRQGQYEWVWDGQGDNHGYVELLRPCWY